MRGQPKRHRRRLIAVGVFGVGIGVIALVSPTGRDVLEGLVVWSLVGAAYAIFVVALGRHASDVGGYMGGKTFAGHSHDDRPTPPWERRRPW